MGRGRGKKGMKIRERKKSIERYKIQWRKIKKRVK